MSETCPPGPLLHSSVIEISESALRTNLRFLREAIGPDVELTSVIKGNAYGHGIGTIVPLAERCGIRSFAVSHADEAYDAHRAMSATSRLVIMADVADEEFEWAIVHGVELFVFDRERLARAADTARRVAVPARLHLELETGMHRTGFDAAELPSVAAFVRDHADALTVVGVCTHYAGAESVENYLRIQSQIRAFEEGCAALTRAGATLGQRHTACSAAALTYPETIMDRVRIGIAQYGFWPSEQTRMQWLLRQEARGTPRSNDPLRRVMKWKSRVMSLKSVAAGQFVGYGITHLSTRPQRLAVVPVGYHHGFSRSLSNLGHVLILGRRAPVVGMVNMSMVTVDVTEIPEVRRGDEVVIIGRQKRGEITVGAFSDMTRDLNYEVLVRLPASIPRVTVP